MNDCVEPHFYRGVDCRDTCMIFERRMHKLTLKLISLGRDQFTKYIYSCKERYSLDLPFISFGKKRRNKVTEELNLEDDFGRISYLKL